MSWLIIMCWFYLEIQSSTLSLDKLKENQWVWYPLHQNLGRYSPGSHLPWPWELLWVFKAKEGQAKMTLLKCKGNTLLHNTLNKPESWSVFGEISRAKFGIFGTLLRDTFCYFDLLMGHCGLVILALQVFIFFFSFPSSTSVFYLPFSSAALHFLHSCWQEHLSNCCYSFEYVKISYSLQNFRLWIGDMFVLELS